MAKGHARFLRAAPIGFYLLNATRGGELIGFLEKTTKYTKKERGRAMELG
jgi:hypothetical protein